MERCTGRSDVRPRQSRGILGLSVEVVQATPAIQQDLSQPHFVKDGVNDEWESAWLWEVVGVVGLVKGDCHLRPSKVGRHRLLRGGRRFISRVTSL